MSLAGERVDFATAPIVWGEPGSNAQHSFFQMLHQGTLTQALDFIAPLRGSWGGTEAQDLALQNCFAQSQAFAFGHTLEEVEAEMRKAGASAEEIARIAPHRVHEGNRPSSLLLYPQTTARTLGGLLALYEHSVFVQGTRLGREFLRSVRRGTRQEARRRDRHERAPRPPAGTGRRGLAALIEYVASKR